MGSLLPAFVRKCVAWALEGILNTKKYNKVNNWTKKYTYKIFPNLQNVP